MKYNKCLLVLSALAAVVFTGCKNEDVEKHRFDNKFYITSAILSDDLLIKSDTPGYTKTIESRLAKPAGQQVAVTIEADPSQVAAYNMIYGDNAVALPAECYELSSNQIDIAAGQVSGDAIEIVFKDINTLDGSRRYVLPVTVTSCNGVDLLDSRSTVYFVARQGAMINVVANIAWMNFPVSWSADAKPLVSGMKQVTIEALLRSADWTVARTPEQIAGNMYGVSPESEGLVAYWKFNEGSGSTIIDHANGTNLSAVGGTPTWIPVTLPEIK